MLLNFVYILNQVSVICPLYGDLLVCFYVVLCDYTELEKKKRCITPPHRVLDEILCWASSGVEGTG